MGMVFLIIGVVPFIALLQSFETYQTFLNIFGTMFQAVFVFIGLNMIMDNEDF